VDELEGDVKEKFEQANTFLAKAGIPTFIKKNHKGTIPTA